MKRENTVCRTLKNSVSFSGRTILEIHFDLLHIRFGWDKEKRDYKVGPPRNQYSEDDIVAFFEQLNALLQNSEEQSVRLKSVESRYIFYIYDEGRKLKMVVDFMKNKATVVVTIH
jgi:hypothetical protein